MTKVEEVARALYEATPFKSEAGGYDQQTDVYKRMCMLLARAAIEAMRRPTEVMIAAGDAVDDPDAVGWASPEVAFDAMITAALSE